MLRGGKPHSAPLWRAGPDPDLKRPHSERSRAISYQMMSGSSGLPAGSPTRQQLLRYLTFSLQCRKASPLCQMLTSHTYHTNAKEDRMCGGALTWKEGCDWRLC